ncbi:hypothetical protein B0H16DRAFT_1823917 [Mycena metata]|uniref:Uncharacterized protein n=1 Tax=Mycena metata TaxID=1033252 RepID=A0AAD7J8W9_9AGAR|nr:hypothetical protein B0H16DRAFT_1823917 [Mycena metata]
MHSADPVLPVELERLIFELAAWQDPETIFALILVAKRVCMWIEPELYHIVLFRKRLLPMLESKPAEFLRQHIHHLAIPAGIEYADVVRILSTCTDVHNLAIWNNTATRPELLPLLCKLTNLQRLSTTLFALCGGFDARLRIPPPEELPFANLTHLDIFGLFPEQLWPVFKMLPRLTHLSLSTNTQPPALINAALNACPLLQVLAVVWVGMSVLPDESKISADPRFCIVQCSHHEFDWKLGAWGGATFGAGERRRWRTKSASDKKV